MPGLLTLLLVTAQWTLAIAVAVRIVLRRRPTGIAIAWLVIVLTLPLFGVCMYLLVGETWLPARRVRRAARHRELYTQALTHAEPREAPDDPWIRALAHQAAIATGVPLTDCNAIELFDGACDTFDSMVRDIDAARRTCFVQSYIWQPGGITAQIADALARAAARGVDCRVLVDAFGGRTFFASSLPARLRSAGVRVVAAMPIGRLRMHLARIDVRNHRKIITIDGRLAYTGSLNVADPAEFKPHAGVGQWVDNAVRVEGPATAALELIFLGDWKLETADPIQADRLAPSPLAAGASRVQVVPSGPGHSAHVLREMLLTFIYGARKELVITTPYFVPGEAIMTALTSAARGGVDVRLVLPAKVDDFLSRHASRAYFRDLLSAGVSIHLFTSGLLHTKTATIDGRAAMLGTANMDRRSFDLNFEVALFVFDEAFAARLRAQQGSCLHRSDPVEAEAWMQRPWTQRLLQNTAQVFSPLL